MVSKGGETQKQKPAFWAGSLNSGAGLGIEPRTRGFSIPSKKTKCSISTNSFLLVCLEKNV